MNTKVDFYIDESNDSFGPVVRWLTSNNIPFADKLNEFLVAGYIDRQIVDNSVSARRIEDAISIKQYVEFRQAHGYSEEERWEMRAAFGDEEIVDIFTGKVVEL